MGSVRPSSPTGSGRGREASGAGEGGQSAAKLRDRSGSRPHLVGKHGHPAVPPPAPEAGGLTPELGWRAPGNRFASLSAAKEGFEVGTTARRFGGKLGTEMLRMPGHLAGVLAGEDVPSDTRKRSCKP